MFAHRGDHVGPGGAETGRILVPAAAFGQLGQLLGGQGELPSDEHRLGPASLPVLGRLERLAGELELQTRVHFTGWVEDVTALLPALDIFVSSSRVEPFGLVMVEAMAAGLPVVATATGGALEIVENGVTGRLVPVGDWQALAEAVTSLLTNEEARRRMGELGHKRAREHFSLERMVSETEALYREVLDAK